MQNLSTSDYKLFCSLAQVSQKSLRKTLKAFLNKEYKTIYSCKDYIYAVGDIPIALCAHMDTVFKSPPKNIFYDREKNVIWSPTGLGADDRAGIFSIIKILKEGYKPSVLFLADEEKGALGAEQLVAECKRPASPLHFIIELDRRGSNDCVFYDCGNEGFVKYIENFGFIENFGSFSDISEICPGWGIAGVNLSIGYDNEHTTSEILYVSSMLSTIKKVKTILNQSNWPQFEYIYKPTTYYTSWYNYPTEYDDYYYEKLGQNMWNSDYHTCAHCGITLHNYELIPALSAEGTLKYYCPDCCSDNVEWCYCCGDAFEKGVLSKKGFCPTCTSKYAKKGKS